jgi:hypothetical protein
MALLEVHILMLHWVDYTVISCLPTYWRHHDLGRLKESDPEFLRKLDSFTLVSKYSSKKVSLSDEKVLMYLPMRWREEHLSLDRLFQSDPYRALSVAFAYERLDVPALRVFFNPEVADIIAHRSFYVDEDDDNDDDDDDSDDDDLDWWDVFNHHSEVIEFQFLYSDGTAEWLDWVAARRTDEYRVAHYTMKNGLSSCRSRDNRHLSVLGLADESLLGRCP